MASDLSVDCFGSMTMPEVAIGVLSRAAIFGVAIGVIPIALIRARRNHFAYMWLLPILGAIFLAFSFPWNIEYGVTRTIYVTIHSQVGSVGFFTWPPRWIAPVTGISAGIVAGLIFLIWTRKRMLINERSQPRPAPDR